MGDIKIKPIVNLMQFFDEEQNIMMLPLCDDD